MQDAHTWADYINVGMEHGCFDMTGLAAYMRGLVAGGPTASGHRTPTVIVEAVVNGTDEPNVRFSSWQFRQILARGVHGNPALPGGDRRRRARLRRGLPLPHQHRRRRPLPALPARPPARGPDRARPAAPRWPRRAAPAGPREARQGPESEAAAVWGVSGDEYVQRCDPWPLNPRGSCSWGSSWRAPRGGQLRGDPRRPRPRLRRDGPRRPQPLPGLPPDAPRPVSPEMAEAREDLRRLPQERGGLPLRANAETIGARIDEGCASSPAREETARAGRAHPGAPCRSSSCPAPVCFESVGACASEFTGGPKAAGAGVKERSGMGSAERRRRSRGGALARPGLGLAGTALPWAD